jgi:hypothetical protein
VKINDVRLERSGAGARAVARVTWEDCPRPPLDLFFETDESGSEDMQAAPEAFVTACILPAMRDGERRLEIEGPLCPRLVDGAASAIAMLAGWWGPPRRAVVIEARAGLKSLRPRRPERAAVFLTGGVDSRHLLRTNRRHFDEGHPARIVEGLSVFGHLCPSNEVTVKWNDRLLAALSGAAKDLRLPLVRVRTNIWELAPDVEFLASESLSSAIASATHLFRSRWSSVMFASSRELTRQPTRGTHALLDPLWSSSALEVRYLETPLTRLERLHAIADEPPGVRDLLVCLAFPAAPHLNCGECEKCVRTMLELVTVGRLAEARHFPRRVVEPQMVAAIAMNAYQAEDYWKELVPALERVGRSDLAAAVVAKIEQCRRDRVWASDAGWKGRLRRFDRRVLGGRMLAARRRLF